MLPPNGAAVGVEGGDPPAPVRGVFVRAEDVRRHAAGPGLARGAAQGVRVYLGQDGAPINRSREDQIETRVVGRTVPFGAPSNSRAETDRYARDEVHGPSKETPKSWRFTVVVAVNAVLVPPQGSGNIPS